MVEDEADLALIVADTLRGQGYEVLTAGNGIDGLDKFKTCGADIVVADVMMPEMDGFTMARAIRKTSPTVPLLFLTAKSTIDDVEKGFEIGANDYLKKPFELRELIVRIKALLRRAQIASERKIIVGDVILDYDSMTVTKKGETQELPQKEFLLLYKLLSYPGKIFTRIQLMDEIWGTDSETGWETVTVHIGRLRRRFEGWEEFEIESVRGLGYKAVKKVC